MKSAAFTHAMTDNLSSVPLLSLIVRACDLIIKEHDQGLEVNEIAELGDINNQLTRRSSKYDPCWSNYGGRRTRPTMMKVKP